MSLQSTVLPLLYNSRSERQWVGFYLNQSPNGCCTEYPHVPVLADSTGVALCTSVCSELAKQVSTSEISLLLSPNLIMDYSQAEDLLLLLDLLALQLLTVAHMCYEM